MVSTICIGCYRCRVFSLNNGQGVKGVSSATCSKTLDGLQAHLQPAITPLFYKFTAKMVLITALMYSETKLQQF